MEAQREVGMERDREERRKWTVKAGRAEKAGEKEREQAEREVMDTNPGTTTPHTTGSTVEVSHTVCNNCSLLSAQPLEPHSSFAGPQPPPNLHRNWTPQ